MSDLEWIGTALATLVVGAWVFLVALVAVTINQRRSKRRRPVLLLPCAHTPTRGAVYLTARGPARSRSRRTRSVRCARQSGPVTA